LWLVSSDTVSLFLPFARRAANTLLPFGVAIRSRKPCLFFLFLFEGWNVLFIALCFYIFLQLMIFSVISSSVELFLRMQRYTFFESKKKSTKNLLARDKNNRFSFKILLFKNIFDVPFRKILTKRSKFLL
jgi:hypothetical protein